MTSETWVGEVAALLAAQVKHYRKQRGMTAAQLSEACAALGADVPTSVINNLETGRRASFDVAELLVVAKALDVAPLLLLFPVGRQETVRVLPDRVLPVWEAAAWFTDETPLTHAPAPGTPRAVIDSFRQHADAVTTALTSQRLLGEQQRKANTTLNETRRQDHLRSADQLGQLLLQDAQALRSLRAEMRSAGLLPPALPQDLAFVDNDEDEDALAADGGQA